MEELTKEKIIKEFGFKDKSPLLILKFPNYRLSVSQTKQKTGWGWKLNEFKVEKLRPHGECKKIALINYIAELRSIVGSCA